MRIAIDFDDTYTRDPEMWNKVIREFILAGHAVYCVTARNPQMMADVHDTIGEIIGIDFCIPTSLKCKRTVTESLNIFIDVWIDDTPDAIVSNFYSKQD